MKMSCSSRRGGSVRGRVTPALRAHRAARAAQRARGSARRAGAASQQAQALDPCKGLCAGARPGDAARLARRSATSPRRRSRPAACVLPACAGAVMARPLPVLLSLTLPPPRCQRRRLNNRTTRRQDGASCRGARVARVASSVMRMGTPSLRLMLTPLPPARSDLTPARLCASFNVGDRFSAACPSVGQTFPNEFCTKCVRLRFRSLRTRARLTRPPDAYPAPAGAVLTADVPSCTILPRGGEQYGPLEGGLTSGCHGSLLLLTSRA